MNFAFSWLFSLGSSLPLPWAPKTDWNLTALSKKLCGKRECLQPVGYRHKFATVPIHFCTKSMTSTKEGQLAPCFHRHSRNIQHGCFKACPLTQSNTKKACIFITSTYIYLSIYPSIYVYILSYLYLYLYIYNLFIHLPRISLQIFRKNPSPIASYQPCTGFSLGGLIQKHQSPLPDLESCGFGWSGEFFAKNMCTTEAANIGTVYICLNFEIFGIDA